MAHGHSVEDAEIVCMRSIHVAETTEKARDFVRSLPPRLPFALVYNPYEESSNPAQPYDRESAPIDHKTGKIAKGYEYWEKGYAGKLAPAWEVNTDDAWNERWVAGDLERVHKQIEELESIGVRNVVCSFSERGVAARDALPETRKRMDRFAREVIEPFQRKSTVRNR